MTCSTRALARLRFLEFGLSAEWGHALPSFYRQDFRIRGALPKGKFVTSVAQESIRFRPICEPTRGTPGKTKAGLTDGRRASRTALWPMPTISALSTCGPHQIRLHRISLGYLYLELEHMLSLPWDDVRINPV
jgi:hypothetical protein